MSSWRVAIGHEGVPVNHLYGGWRTLDGRLWYPALFDFGLSEVKGNTCGWWFTFACYCQGFCDEQLGGVLIPYLSVVSCVCGHDTRLSALTGETNV